MATNTVPIEIVLQDPNNPIVPDTPGDNPGENTNISVPDTALGTGYTTKDGRGTGNIFTGSNATVSIASIVVLVLALGAIVTLLVRRYQKHKKCAENKETKAKVGKGEKLATVATATLAVLAATVLVGNLVIPVTSAATDDTATNREGELVVDDKITITVTREADSDEAIVSSIDTKSYATVYKTFGYEVAIAMAGNTTNLYLDGDTSSEYYIAPVSDGTLADNTWGYTLDGEEYTAMPLIDDLAVVAKGTTEVTNEEVDINYGVKVSSDMPNGTYTGEIEYILADTGFPAALRTMQDMTTDICNSVPTPNPFKADNTTIEDNVPTIMLPDSRDNKLYRVAKLADGKCWMAQNLDLQAENIKQGVTLSSENTDGPADNFALLASQTSGNDSWGSSSSQTDVETKHVYDIAASGTTYKYCYNYRGYCAEYGDEIPAAELGNLYNWYTATAGTGTYDVGSGDDRQATGSICPKGWRLPNNGNSSMATDYSNLLYQYGITKSATDSSYVSPDKVAIYKAPLSLVPTGNYSGGLNNVGDRGYLWSSLAGSSSYIKGLYFDAGYVNPWDGYGNKLYGYAVRCVAR